MRIGVTSFVVAICFFCISSCNTTVQNEVAEQQPEEITTVKKNNYPYGIPVDSLKAFEGTIRSNKFLSDILLQYGLTFPEISQTLQSSSDVFDVRKVIAGNKYTVYCDTLPELRARYMLYEHDAYTNYVLSFSDSMNITKFQKEIESEIKYASCTISSSLWDAMIENGVNPMMAVELSEIFAWTVDFFGLQKGDRFKMIYEERSVENRSLGSGRVYGAQYISGDKTYTAIPFVQDSIDSYFDVDGTSLRKAFLKAPLQYSRISSRFSSGRMHPVLRVVRPHYGVDYAAPTGTPVVSIGDGKVISVTYDSSSGNMVKIKHNSVYTTAYLHLSRFGPGIKSGVSVKQGQVIGYVGSTGVSTGPHLDFRIYLNGSPVDPLKVESPSVDPIHEENMDRFEMSKSVVLELLNSIPDSLLHEEAFLNDTILKPVPL